MKYFFTYNKEDGRVANYSMSLNKVSDKFNQIELSISPEEQELLERNYWPWIKNDELILEKSPLIMNEEKGKKIEEAKEKMKNIQSLEALKDLLIQIFN